MLLPQSSKEKLLSSSSSWIYYKDKGKDHRVSRKKVRANNTKIYWRDFLYCYCSFSVLRLLSHGSLLSLLGGWSPYYYVQYTMLTVVEVHFAKLNYLLICLFSLIQFLIFFCSFEYTRNLGLCIVLRRKVIRFSSFFLKSFFEWKFYFN